MALRKYVNHTRLGGGSGPLGSWFSLQLHANGLCFVHFLSRAGSSRVSMRGLDSETPQRPCPDRDSAQFRPSGICSSGDGGIRPSFMLGGCFLRVSQCVFVVILIRLPGCHALLKYLTSDNLWKKKCHRCISACPLYERGSCVIPFACRVSRHKYTHFMTSASLVAHSKTFVPNPSAFPPFPNRIATPKCRSWGRSPQTMTIVSTPRALANQLTTEGRARLNKHTSRSEATRGKIAVP